MSEQNNGAKAPQNGRFSPKAKAVRKAQMKAGETNKAGQLVIDTKKRVQIRINEETKHYQKGDRIAVGVALLEILKERNIDFHELTEKELKAEKDAEKKAKEAQKSK